MLDVYNLVEDDVLRRAGAVACGRLVGVGHEAEAARAPVAPHDDAARHAPEALEVRPELAVAARVREAAHEELAVADVEVRGRRRAVRELPPCSLRSRRRGAPLRRPPRRAIVVGIGPAEAVPDLARRRPAGRSAGRSAGSGARRGLSQTFRRNRLRGARGVRMDQASKHLDKN